MSGTENDVCMRSFKHMGRFCEELAEKAAALASNCCLLRRTGWHWCTEEQHFKSFCCCCCCASQDPDPHPAHLGFL